MFAIEDFLKRSDGKGFKDSESILKLSDRPRCRNSLIFRSGVILQKWVFKFY